MSDPKARPLAMRWETWAAVAAVASAAFLVVRVTGVAILARDRGTAVTTSTGPTPAERALALRTQAYAACKQSKWDACLAGLDEAAQLDPAGDTAPEVVDARQVAKKGEEDEARTLKPHGP